MVVTFSIPLNHPEQLWTLYFESHPSRIEFSGSLSRSTPSTPNPSSQDPPTTQEMAAGQSQGETLSMDSVQLVTKDDVVDLLDVR
jgi:hypothetical protein